MGSLVQDFLPVLCKILTTIFKLSKKFYYESKEAQGPIIDEMEESDGEEDEDNILDPLKRNTLNS